MLKHEIDDIRNQARTCETYVLMKKEVTDLYETLSQFTRGNEIIDLILSSQRPSLNKTRLGFKSS